VRISKEVEVVKEEDTLGPGDFFGVISTMSGHSHIETAQALTNVTLIFSRFFAVLRNNHRSIDLFKNPVGSRTSPAKCSAFCRF
jgi:CRP-like cAMP-binding protein